MNSFWSWWNGDRVLMWKKYSHMCGYKHYAWRIWWIRRNERGRENNFWGKIESADKNGPYNILARNVKNVYISVCVCAVKNIWKLYNVESGSRLNIVESSTIKMETLLVPGIMAIVSKDDEAVDRWRKKNEHSSKKKMTKNWKKISMALKF